LNSKDSIIETSIKTREIVNQELQKQLKISELILAVITRLVKLQNIVLTTTSKYTADFLIKNKKI
jgi:hypothetical protein